MIEESFPTVIMYESQPSVSSLDVAKHFAKPHNDVLKSIRKVLAECPESFSQGNFSQISYQDDYGREQPMYYLTRDAFTLLAMGFTGKRALEWKIKYIEAFNMLEGAVRNLAAIEAKPGKRQKALPPTPFDDPEPEPAFTREQLTRARDLIDLIDMHGRLTRKASKEFQEIMRWPYRTIPGHTPRNRFADSMDFTVRSTTQILDWSLLALGEQCNAYFEGAKLLNR